MQFYVFLDKNTCFCYACTCILSFNLEISFYRSFAKPPKAVQTVCECIVILRGIREVSWKSAKGMMSEANFLAALKRMDVDAITQKQTAASKCRFPIF